MTADEGMGAVVGEHREIQRTSRLLEIFSFEGKCGQIETDVKDVIYTNMVDGKEIQIKDRMIGLKMCPVIIESIKRRSM